MLTYGERLTSFTSAWPHASPSPQDLADAGFSYRPTSDLLDNVICQLCNTQLCDWEPADDPIQEHYRCSKSCMRLTEGDLTLMFVQDAMVLPQKDSQASVQADLPASPQVAPTQIAPQTSPALKPSPKDIGFLDPSLHHNFPELCLFHNANTFCDRIERRRSESGFLGADILALLPKCLRGEALTWFRSQSECQDLATYIQALKARFPQQAPSQEAPQASSQAAPQEAPQPIDYHHCKLCNASFSNTARLIRHTQEDVCNKPSCRHCDTVFSSKNRLHQHLREECRKQTRSSSASSRSSSSTSPTWSSTWPSLSSPPCSPTWPSTCSPASSPSPPPEENRASLPPSLPPSPSPPPQYRVLSPPPPTYGNFLTVEDLFARYAPRYLKMDDLFRMFGRRSARSSTIPTSARSFGVPIAPVVAPGHPPIRHRGRCLAKKGDGSTQMPKHLPKHPNTKQQQNQKQKIDFVRTSLQPTPYKSVLPLQRSRSMSCPMVTPGSPSFLTSSASKLATNMHWLPMPHIRHVCSEAACSPTCFNSTS